MKRSDGKLVLSEEMILTVLNDFEIFYRYIAEKKPKLLKTKDQMAKKESFELNALLSFPRKTEKATYSMDAYPTVNFWFHVSQVLGLTEMVEENDKTYLYPGPMYSLYQKIDAYHKYALILQCFWREAYWEDLFEDLPVISSLATIQKISLGLEGLMNLESGESVTAVSGSLLLDNPVEWLMLEGGNVLHSLAVLGFWDIEILPKAKKEGGPRVISLDKLQMKPLGSILTKVLATNPLNEANVWFEDYIEQDFSDALQEHFPLQLEGKLIEDYLFIYNLYEEGLIDEEEILEMEDPRDVEEEEKEEVEVEVVLPEKATKAPKKAAPKAAEKTSTTTDSYIFKVNQDGKIWRRIQISSVATLHNLHKAILEAFDFDDDHLYAYFMDNKAWSRQVYWSPGCDEGPYTNKVKLYQLALQPKMKFLYLFDFGDEWRFKVTLEKIVDEELSRFQTKVIEEKGKARPQYPDRDDEEDEELPF